jgi:hypothetical protein
MGRERRPIIWRAIGAVSEERNPKSQTSDGLNREPTARPASFVNCSPNARNAAGTIALVADIDWPLRAVTMRVLDVDGGEVHLAIRGRAIEAEQSETVRSNPSFFCWLKRTYQNQPQIKRNKGKYLDAKMAEKSAAGTPCRIC